MGARMALDVEDGVAKLRNDYSGFWQWLHLLALSMFVAPYATFVVRQVIAAKLVCGDLKCRPLSAALAEHVWTGGRYDGFAFWPVTIFCFSLLYSALRFILLAKTKMLELEQESRGMPVRFSLEGSAWGTWLNVAHVGFWVNVVLVLIHTSHFFGTYVPGR